MLYISLKEDLSIEWVILVKDINSSALTELLFSFLALRNAFLSAVTAGWQPLSNISHPRNWWLCIGDKLGDQQLLRRPWGDGKFGLTHHKSPFTPGPQTPFLESNMADFSGCRNKPCFFIVSVLSLVLPIHIWWRIEDAMENHSGHSWGREESSGQNCFKHLIWKLDKAISRHLEYLRSKMRKGKD